ncbi:tyrosine-type recombinase/integrase [Clostridium pasteurianum]|uniref:Site-specific recombinase XerD n=1 Tax=Clostridium pasteurianum BC1 TaxID=86416 RepID=R4JY16_CLOPA|nr:site-specific integrase [Clostridium pasteurianum]AGK95173.1 site-specific recombinase XerD [Clostridium pasteurianum BC1]
MPTKTNVIKNGQQYYRVYLELGRDSEGNRKRKEFYGRSKKDAEAKLEKYKNGLHLGLSTDYDTLTIGKTCKLWLFEKVKNSVKPSTFERYEAVYRLYIKPSPLYSVKLKDLKSLIIQQYYNSLIKNGKTPNVVYNLNKLLKMFLNYCVAEGFIVKNYCSPKSISIPMENKNSDDSIKVFTVEEQNKFIEAVGGHRLKALFLLDLGTGLRIGELIALTWNDIDLVNYTLSVNKAIKGTSIFEGDNKKYHLIEQTPKTKSSYRTIPFPRSLVPILEQYKEKKESEKEKFGNDYIKNEYVFCTPIGSVIDPNNLRGMYRRILKKAKIDYKKFHSLRHTYATRLFEAGVPLKTVQTLLGHNDISITANIYTHVMPEEKVKAIDKINSIFDNSNENSGGKKEGK